jgi:phage baseplate assembly protein W
MTGPSDGTTETGLLGWSLAAPQTAPGVALARDVTWATGPSGRDLAIVSGPENLEQALSVALTTRLGDDVFNTGFGFDGLDALAQETNPVLARERVRIAVIRTIQADPRVRRVVDVRLDNGSSDERSTAALRAGRELRVRVVFETVSYQQGTIELRTGGHG